MAKKILFYIHDLERITGCTYDHAQREHKAIRDALGCKKHLTLEQYCEFEGLPYDEIYAFLVGDSSHPGLDIR